MSRLLLSPRSPLSAFFFFFNCPATTEIYTLSLHDALPIWFEPSARPCSSKGRSPLGPSGSRPLPSPTSIGCIVTSPDRKSTRLNSSHTVISYAVFCLKKKKKKSIQLLHT